MEGRKIATGPTLSVQRQSPLTPDQIDRICRRLITEGKLPQDFLQKTREKLAGQRKKD